MARVKLEEEQELWEPAEVEHSVGHEFKEEPECRGVQSPADTCSVVHFKKEEPEEVEFKPEPLPQFVHVFVKSEEEEPQSSLLHQIVTEENREDTDAAGAGSHKLPESEAHSENSSDTDNSEDLSPLAERSTPQTQSEGNRAEAEEPCSSDSESSWDFNPPTKTKAWTKRPMVDLVNSVSGHCFQTVPRLRSHKCPVCERSFYTKCHLNRHVSSHTGEYTWKCPVCAEVFKHRGHLELHMRAHKGEKRCSVCTKRFKRVSSLKLHMRTHTGDKPYSCTVCEKKFPYLSSLNVHERTHTGERPFPCPVCAKAFAQSCNLKAHMKIHSKKKTL